MIKDVNGEPLRDEDVMDYLTGRKPIPKKKLDPEAEKKWKAFEEIWKLNQRIQKHTD